MSRIEKLIARFKLKLKDFTYDELKTMMKHFGYIEIRKSGSSRAFVNDQTKHIIRLHRPHPQNVLKKYQIDEVYDELIKRGLI